MTRTNDLKRMEAQEARLRFESFDLSTAWELGARLRTRAEERGLAILIEIRLAGRSVFLSAMPGTGATNADWARRKANAVELLKRSSYALGREAAEKGTIHERLSLSPRDFAAAGGGFPILLASGMCLGAIVVSGLPQREDHKLVVEIIAEFLGVPLAGLQLDF